MAPIRHARAPHRALSTTSQPSHSAQPGAEPGAMMVSLPTRSTPSSVTSRNALCENAIGLNDWACLSSYQLPAAGTD